MPEDPRPDACERLLQFFAFAHLRDDLKPVVMACHTHAQYLLRTCPHTPELTLALRDLISAKDNAVRALLSHED